MQLLDHILKVLPVMSRVLEGGPQLLNAHFSGQLLRAEDRSAAFIGTNLCFLVYLSLDVHIH